MWRRLLDSGQRKSAESFHVSDCHGSFGLEKTKGMEENFGQIFRSLSYGDSQEDLA